MRVLLAGAGGMIGSTVAPYLAGQEHTVVRLVGRAPGVSEVSWNPDAGTVDAAWPMPSFSPAGGLRRAGSLRRVMCSASPNLKPHYATSLG